jgi:AraC-like DNA-binding protein
MTNSFHHEDQFHWTDPSQAQEMVRLLLWPHTLSLAAPGSRVDARMWSRRILNIAVNDISYGADVTIVPGRLESWYAVMIPLARDPHAFDQPLVATTAEQMLMTRLLEGADHNYRDELAVQGPAAPSRLVRQAVGLIESHPEGEHTVDTLAGAVGVSRRSLERALRRHTGMSPWQYVKSVRLRRAHAQLRAADPELVTVGERGRAPVGHVPQPVLGRALANLRRDADRNAPGGGSAGNARVVARIESERAELALSRPAKVIAAKRQAAAKLNFH